jgi:hypothetical protein
MANFSNWFDGLLTQGNMGRSRDIQGKCEHFPSVAVKRLGLPRFAE